MSESDADANVQPAAAVVAYLAGQPNGAAAWNWMVSHVEPAINGDLTHSVDVPRDLTFRLLKDIGW